MHKFLIILIFFGLLSCKATQSNQIPKSNIDLKEFWSEVEEYEQKGLWQSALNSIDSILPIIAEMSHPNEVLKALQKGMRYQDFLTTTDEPSSIKWMQLNLQHLDGNAKAIAYSILAEKVEQYYLQNSWKLKERSYDPNFRPEELNEWSARHLIEYTDSLYQKSLNIAKPLEKLTDLGELVIWDDGAQDYQPTVYYFLYDRYHQFLVKDHQIVLEKEAPYISEQEALSSRSSFLNFKIEEPSKYYKTLKDYQDLLRHAKENENQLLILKTDLNRLEYAWSKSSHPDRKGLFEGTLDNLIKELVQTPLFPEVAFYAASYYIGIGSEDKEIQKANVLRAWSICKEALKSEEVEALKNCQQILTQIENPVHDVKVEEVNPVGIDFRALVTHKNVSELQMHLYKMSEEELRSWERLEEKNKPEWVKNLKKLNSWNQHLIDEGDFIKHRVEIKIEGLPAGTYLLCSEDDQKLSTQFNIIRVSNLAYISRQAVLNNEIYVVNRITGEPMAGVTVRCMVAENNRNRRTAKWIQEAEGTTDDQGKYIITDSKQRYFRIKLEYKNDILFLNDGIYGRYSNRGKQARNFVQYFTDRAIYRPGQIIYFKGIAIQNSPEDLPSYLIGQNLEVELVDANGQVVSSSEFRTNEFGSFNGQFVLPQGVLKGRFLLRSNLDQQVHVFRVEEYKRPKFEVTLDTLDSVFVLDQMVQLKGRANSLVGTPIQRARVKYSITQLPVYLPYYNHFSRFQSNNPILVKQAEVRTTEDGEFSIDFMPKSTPGTDKTARQNYQVAVEITDLNGETRVTSGIYAFDKQGKYLDLKTELIWPNRQEPIFITYRTTQNDPLIGTLSLKLYKLKNPDHVVRKRMWEDPDQWIMSKGEYSNTFPLDPYAGEGNMKNWSTESQIAESESIEINHIRKWTPAWQLGSGAYKLIVSDGAIIDSLFFVNLNNERLPFVDLHLTDSVKLLQPADQWKGEIISNAGMKNYLVEISSRSGKSINWYNKSTVLYDLVELDRGGVNINISGINQNRYFNTNKRVEVPWTNKKLNIQLTTFREELKPGQKESWKIKVTDHNGNPVKGKLTSTLYDAALDYFSPHHWNTNWYPTYYNNSFLVTPGFQVNHSVGLYINRENSQSQLRGWFYFQNNQFGGMPRPAMKRGNAEMSVMSAVVENESIADADDMKEQAVDQAIVDVSMTNPQILQIRKNLNETVFFMPDIDLDNIGEADIGFTMNEALTSWKWKLLVHDQNLASSVHEEQVITKKDIMVFPNFPRIIREGDEIYLPVKVTNASDKTITTNVELELYDPVTEESLNSVFGNIGNLELNLPVNGSENVSWKIMVPFDFKRSVGYRVVATSGDHIDGEEGIIPVLSNQVFLTETLPLTVNGDQNKTIFFEALQDKFNDDGLQPYSFTIEMNEQPIWLVVKSLPLLLKDEHSNSISEVNRLFANSIVKNIFNSNPSILPIIQQWSEDGDLISPLQENESLKNIVLQETPWLAEALKESENMQLLTSLSNPNVLNNAIESNVQKLKDYQRPDGGFSWCQGGRSNFYVTLYIFDQLRKLSTKNIASNMINNFLDEHGKQAVKYMDYEMDEIYKLDKKVQSENQRIRPIHLKYLMTRSYLIKKQVALDNQKTIFDYYKSIAYKHWIKSSLPIQVQIGLLAHEVGDEQQRNEVINSLLETSKIDKILGRYWNWSNSYHWNDRPLENQSQIIELFTLSKKPTTLIDECKTWLLRNKQTQMWTANVAVASAVYSLLGSQPVGMKIKPKPVSVQIDGFDIRPETGMEAGTGYWKRDYPKGNFNSGYANIEVNNPNDHTVWGGAYFQYFQDADKVTSAENNGLMIERKLYYTKDDGNITPVSNQNLRVGDRIRVALKIKSDRRYEFVHLRDVRGSGLEPTSTLSRYTYKGGIGYYQSTSDAGQDFYFDLLPKGDYILEYDVYVAQSGNYSTGISKLQCLYAPEFGSHSTSERIQVNEEIN